MNPQVDGYVRKNKRWHDELQALRRIILDCGLVEEVKWRVPCYTDAGRNVVFLGVFKDSCTLSFVKGALLKDTQALLEAPGPNTQSARLIRFRDSKRIDELQALLSAYVQEAIAIERAGLKVVMKRTADFAVPEEFQSRLDADAALRDAFAALTPGRQRGYLLHFSSAKQSKTRAARVEAHRLRILAGKGIDDD
ncbi:MAG: YdeI/OmpD-associated family protein [Tepidisphaeraceae bacterium]